MLSFQHCRALLGKTHFRDTPIRVLLVWLPAFAGFPVCEFQTSGVGQWQDLLLAVALPVANLPFSRKVHCIGVLACAGFPVLEEHRL